MTGSGQFKSRRSSGRRSKRVAAQSTPIGHHGRILDLLGVLQGPDRPQIDVLRTRGTSGLGQRRSDLAKVIDVH